MYANLKSISDLFRFTLPAFTATLLLCGSAVAQHYEFDTRYQPTNSMSPWHSQQAFPSGFHQLEASTMAAQPIVEAIPSQPIIQPMITETLHPQTLTVPTVPEVLAFPQHPVVPAVETPLVEVPLPETHMIGTPMVETPMTETPIIGAESELPTQWNQEVPEGYDPAYPIEYPGSNFQGYYPVDGGVVAPPTGEILGETSPSQAGSDSIADTDSSSSDPEAPMIPSVVVADSETDIVMPEPGTINESTGQTIGQTSMTDSDDLSAENMAVEAAIGDTKSESELIRKLKQKLQAADLRAREAEEKAMAIARQASEDQKQLDRLKAQTTESKSSMAQTKSQETALQQKVDQLKTELDASNAAVKRMKSLVAKNQKKMKQLKETLTQPNEPMKQIEAQGAEATLQLDHSRNEAPGGIEVKNATARDAAEGNPQKTKRNKPSKKIKLTEKVSTLETARDKQLASAAARIESDFQAKINAKLDSGKTANHPEVKTLKDSLQQRLKESDKNIRRRYQRQINKILKEAAARSRS